MNHRPVRIAISLFFLAALFLSACGGEKKEERIALPEAGPLSLSLGWGVVLTNYIRIRATPEADGIEITALAKGAIVRLIDKGKRETLRDVTDFWYQVNDDRNRGWLFGAHLSVFHERGEAEAFQAGLKEKAVE